MPLKPGDILLMSSDGMTDLVEDHEILAAFEENRTPQQTVDALVLLARQRGGFDNITITAIMVPGSPEPAAIVKTDSGSLTPALFGSIVLAAVLVLGLVAVAIGAYFVFSGNNPPTSTLSATVPPPTITATVRATLTVTPQEAILQPDTPTALPPTATRTPVPTQRDTPVPNVSLTAAWLTLTAEMQSQEQTLTALAPSGTPSTP
jgi:protein phosphatase